MWLGIVIGNVWCTKKVSALTGQTFLLVAPEGHQGPALVCADQAGAGPGDRVLVTRGSGARVAAGESIPVDAHRRGGDRGPGGAMTAPESSR